MDTSSQKNHLLQDLIKLALAGDQNSYHQFLTQISVVIRVIVAKKIPVADIEDVVQEVLISVHKARHTYDGNRPIMPWLVAITRFRINDYLRKHYAEMHHKTSDIEEFFDILIDVINEPVNYELVDEMLAIIDVRQKKILTMMHIEGHTAKEVGLALGMNESAVKVAAHRAVKKIKQQFVKC